jgi:hypothetical protein
MCSFNIRFAHVMWCISFLDTDMEVVSSIFHTTPSVFIFRPVLFFFEEDTSVVHVLFSYLLFSIHQYLCLFSKGAGEETHGRVVYRFECPGPARQKHNCNACSIKTHRSPHIGIRLRNLDRESRGRRRNT